ncbi:polysaccharide deacetylase family protein [Geotalea toluenoxydans]|uniref:polysaccharide deacetylase family protein n=1 Tax=Geotalea toluenoxydans TaxID=421624 RepID=UPI0006D01634|nr:hypothetical protein [Geotalea toluenoxydans]
MKTNRVFLINPFNSAVLLAALLFFIVASPAVAADKISGYKSLFHVCRDEAGNLQLAIRQFILDSVTYLLLVNPRSLQTSIVPASTTTSVSAGEAKAAARSPFATALERFTAQPRLQNAGLTHGESSKNGLFLSVDLCPSKKPFEREMFTAVADMAGKTGGPVPVAVAITGYWLAHHQGEMEWLKGEVAGGRLAITWVNHSHSHPYDPKKPFNLNFLLTPTVDFEQEVLSTETALLENGLLPSIFFRFPGLVADGRLLKKLRQLSLIPVGSDAWLAKGETPTNGSIVLVHGNGNEPQGIKKLLPLLRSDNPPRLLPLKDAVAGSAS